MAGLDFLVITKTGRLDRVELGELLRRKHQDKKGARLGLVPRSNELGQAESRQLVSVADNMATYGHVCNITYTVIALYQSIQYLISI